MVTQLTQTLSGLRDREGAGAQGRKGARENSCFHSDLRPQTSLLNTAVRHLLTVLLRENYSQDITVLSVQNEFLP